MIRNSYDGDNGSALALRGHAGLQLTADAFGDASNPPVVLMHGGGQTRHAWGSTAQALAREGWYAVSLDLRGHGDSGWAEDGNYSIEAFVEDLRAVTRSFDTRPVLVGASLGGITALMAEGELAPGLSAAVVLVDITPRIEPEGVERIVGFMSARPEGFESLDEAADAIAAYLPHRKRPANLEGLGKNLRRGEDGRYRWHWDPRFMSEVHGPRVATDPTRLERAARALRVPTLLVRGKLSDLVSEEAAREFLALVPHAVFADVSEAGHMVAGDRNDMFTASVLDFLRPLRPGQQR